MIPIDLLEWWNLPLLAPSLNSLADGVASRGLGRPSRLLRREKRASFHMRNAYPTKCTVHWEQEGKNIPTASPGRDDASADELIIALLVIMSQEFTDGMP